ncbi:MAG: amino acid permease [Bacteroidetes bacterium]|nr:MAG: amino acid permease [Bacteroidota bacterium]
MEESFNQTDRSKIPLNRVLGLSTGILLVAGTMIGSGAFKKIAPMAQTGLNEILILLAWIVAGIITMFGAFTYAGLASLTNKTGGVYEYLRLVYGDFIAFLFGWVIFLMGGSGAIAALAFVFSQSANNLFHFPNPFDSLKDFSLGNFIFPFASSGVKIFALLVIIILTWVNTRGVKNGGVLNNVVTAAKILGILTIIIWGLFYSGAQPANATATVPEISSGLAAFSAFFGAMLSALWAYDGWANITYVTGEIRNPQKNVPLAIMGGVGIAMTLYVLLNFVFMRVMPLQNLAAVGENQIAATEVARVLMGNPGHIVISVLIMVSTFGAVNACIIVYPRVYYRMAQENAFFKKASYVHPVFRTPYISLIYSCIWSCILVITGTFDLLTNLVIFSGYLFFILVVWGMMRLKSKGVILTKVIGYPVIPIIIILFSFILVGNTFIVEPRQSVIGLALVLSGIPFFYLFKKNKSVENTGEPL